jgi:hypothetical protein
MKEIVATVHMQAPPAAVFAACTDFAGAAERITAITKMEVLTPGPVGKGTRFRETRKMMGKEATETMEVIEFTQDRSYVLGAESCGCRYRTELTFTSSGDGTDVSIHFRGTPLTFMAKVMAAVMAPMMSGMLWKCLEGDLADIKKHVEAKAQ